MGKVLLTIIVFLLAAFVIFTKDISKGLKVFLIICLVISEVLIITML